MGVATLFRFIGYDIATFIVEALVHSAHIRDPNAIMEDAGYYGQAVKELSTCLSTFLVPVLNFVSPKWTLVIGSGMFGLYFVSFFFINNVLYFIANILLGAAFACKFQYQDRQELFFTVIYTSFYSCQMNFSTRNTLTRNSARIQGIASLSLITGGALYIYITSKYAGISESIPSQEEYRYYGESETRTLCLILAAFCMVNLMLTCWLPTSQIENSVASESSQPMLSIARQLKLTASTMIDPYVLIFVPRFVNHGLLISFFMNVYPTSLQYSSILAKPYPMITAYYAFAMCGIVVAPLNRYFNDFGLRPLFFIATGVQLVAYSLAVLTVPNYSTARPSAGSAFFQPHLLWVLVIAFLLGFTDSANVASGAMLCSRILPGRAVHTYSASRFYRGIAAFAVFFFSPILTMRAHVVILISVTLISTLTFDFAVQRIEKREKAMIPLSESIDSQSTSSATS